MPDLRTQLQATLQGSYVLERELGGGGMSRVFVANETALSRRVVVKVLPPELVAGVNVDRFKREIVLAAQLQHPHIVPVHTAGETNGLPFYTMPFVEGESLRARLAAGPLAITDVIGILRDVAKALAYAHDRGVVHRDIKPDNVLISGGSAVVTDFGIAKAISAARTNASAPTLTQVGSSIGTPAYMAPEQAAADPSANHRVDIYAFGCMAYELLTGQPPFVGKSPQQLLAAQMADSPRPVVELRPDTPPQLADLVMRCLAKDADDRPQRAADLVQVLETVTSGGAHGAMSPILLGGAGMFRKALVVYAVAFVAVAIVAKAAIVSIGLPDWVFPGALVVMALGLPVILFTGYVHRTTRRVLTATPTYTPGGSSSMAHGTMATIAMKASPHVSWRRTTLGGAYALGAFILLIGGFMVLRAMGIGPAGSLFAAGKLGQHEPLLVADFVVKGGADSSLGPVLSEAVRADLGQSNVVTVASASDIRNALQLMQKPLTSALTPALSREIAQRQGIKAVVEGDVTPLAAGFIVTTRLIASETGNELASFRETADGPKDLVPTIEKLTRQLRGKIGESLRDVQASVPLAQVTTSSIDALRKYEAGSRLMDYNNDYARAIPALREAVAIDTDFAAAWRKLGVAYSNALYPTPILLDALDQAYRRRARLTETERLQAVGYYFDRGRGRDRAKAAEAYEAIPVGSSLNNIALLYVSRREYGRADSVFRKYIATGRAPRVSYTNLANTLVFEGKTAAAESVTTVVDTLFHNASVMSQSVLLQYDRGQVDSASTFCARAAADRVLLIKAAALNCRVLMDELRGKLGDAVTADAEYLAVNSARGAMSTGDSVRRMARRAGTSVWVSEQPAPAVAMLDAIIARHPMSAMPVEDRPYIEFATIYAMAGRADRARAILADYDRDVRDTSLLRYQMPLRHGVLGQIALTENRPLDAVREFRLSDQWPDGPLQSSPLSFYASLARASDRANMADSAIHYYEKFLSTPQLNRMALDAQYAAGFHRRLGELYEAKGDARGALAHYQKFVDLWKTADAELQPKVAEIRARVGRLTKAER